MLSKRKILHWVFVAFVVLAIPALWYRLRYVRKAVIDDLRTTRTQTVSVAFRPHAMAWKVSGQIQGTGSVMISHVYSNKVSGSFSAAGGGDYYETNVSLVFVPDGDGTANGKVTASFRFSGFPP